MLGFKLRGPFGEVEVTAGSPPKGSAVPFRRTSPDSVCAGLKPFARNRSNVDAIRRAISQLPGNHDAHQLADSDIYARFSKLIRSGQMNVLAPGREFFPQLTGMPMGQARTAGQGAVAESGYEPIAPPRPKTAWIEIELIDEGDKPVPGEPYKVTLPDDSIREGKLDAKGQARIEKIREGTCKVTFPNLDRAVWKKVA